MKDLRAGAVAKQRGGFVKHTEHKTGKKADCKGSKWEEHKKAGHRKHEGITAMTGLVMTRHRDT